MNEYEKEEWKEIENYPGYFVSSFGNIKSYGRHGKVPTLRHPNMFSNGYNFASLRLKGIRKQVKVSRLVAMHFIPNPENKREVNHIDGNKGNNNIINLEWATRSENQKHAYKIGLQQSKKGEDCPLSKLNKKDVTEIRRLYKNGGIYQNDIAKMFNVARTTISAITNNYNWKNIGKNS